MKILRNSAIVSAAVLTLLTFSSAANAIPAFARKHNLNCSACHTAYPQLNMTGREYKENGYRFPTVDEVKGALEISDGLQLPENMPVSVVLAARPYDKKDSGDKSIRALHEVEVLVAGNLAKNWSGFFEIEAEDETGFDPEIPHAVLNYNYSPELNLQLAYAPVFWADSYGILNDHFRMTRGHVGAIDQRFGGADAGGRFRSSRQNVGVFGRFSDRFFYNVNFSGSAEDAEGQDASIVSGLFNVDITPDIMAGAFIMDGTDHTTAGDFDFNRSGVQFQADVTDLRLQGLYITGTDDRDAADVLLRGPGEDDNSAFSLQAMYTMRDDSLRPTWVPLLRYDTFETNDGADSFDEVTFNLSYYFNQNIKAYIEYWDQIDAPSSIPEDSRLTLQIVAGF